MKKYYFYCLISLFFLGCNLEPKTIIKTETEVISVIETGYIILFSSDGDVFFDTQIIKPGDKIVVPKTPEKIGYIFSGWFLDEDLVEEFDFDTVVTENTILYAKWIEDSKWTITFDSNGGSEVESIIVINGQRAQKPLDPAKEGFLFKGWYLDSDCLYLFDFNTIVSTDIRLFAKWSIDQSIISLSMNDIIPIFESLDSDIIYTIKIVDSNPDLLQLKRVINVNDVKIQLDMSACKELTSFTVDGNSIFYSSSKLYGIIIPDSIEVISGFSECKNLCYAYFNKAKIIRDDAFYHCENLREVSVPSSLEEIGSSAFSGCTSLKTDFILSEAFTSLGYSAFENCKSLKKIEFPNKKISLKPKAFMMSGIQELRIPDGISNIPYYFCDCCINLRAVYLPLSIKEIDSHGFWGCGIKTIYYQGGKYDWGEITIAEYNEEYLDKAEIVYNCEF